MWTFVARPSRRNQEPNGDWTYILDCEDQQLAFGDKEFVERVSNAKVSIAVRGPIDGKRIIAAQRWDSDQLRADGSLSESNGSAWLKFIQNPDHIYVEIVAGTENQEAFRRDLETSLLSNELLISLSLDVRLSDLAGAGALDYRDFYYGDELFSPKPLTYGLVRRVP